MGKILWKIGENSGKRVQRWRFYLRDTVDGKPFEFIKLFSSNANFTEFETFFNQFHKF